MQNTESATLAKPGATEGFWPKGWWGIVDFKIGIVPLPIFIVLLAVIAGFAATGTVPSDILMAIVLLSMGGFTCAELGKRIPIIRNIGAAAIFATFIPSFLAFHHLLPASILGSVTNFTKDSNFLYLFISCIIVGSILGMDRGVLVQGFLKIFIPLIADRSPAPSSARWSALCWVLAPTTRSSLSWSRSCPAASARARSRSPSAMRDPAPAAGRSVRPGAAAGDARQPDGNSAGRHAQLCRQEISAAHRRRTPATGRARRAAIRGGCRGRPGRRDDHRRRGRHRGDALSDRCAGAADVRLSRAGGDAGDRGGC
jgi:hypothetical protein